MSSPRKNTIGGGLPLAICAVAGALIGAYRDQPSLGLLLGVIAGLGVAAVIWLIDRRS